MIFHEDKKNKTKCITKIMVLKLSYYVNRKQWVLCVL